MFSRSRIALVFALLASLIFAVPAFAGGWAVIALDELPTNIVAGEPLTIGFTVLQHGKTPLGGLEPTVTATLLKDSQFVVKAKPDGKTGHYTATLTFPKDGDWTWSIQAFTMDQLMPVLTVAAPAGGVVKQPVVESELIPASNDTPMMILRLLVLGAGIAGLVFAFRKKNRLALALSVLCLVVGVGSFVSMPTVPAVEAQSKPLLETTNESFPLSQEELGARLFVAKGCITCHTNNKVERASQYLVVEAGPNLSTFSASPEVLRIRLKDPAAAKTDTQMPNLGLKEYEIEALIAFINSK